MTNNTQNALGGLGAQLMAQGMVQGLVQHQTYATSHQSVWPNTAHVQITELEEPRLNYMVQRAYLIMRGISTHEAIKMKPDVLRELVKAFRKLETATDLDTELVYAMMDDDDQG